MKRDHDNDDNDAEHETAAIQVDPEESAATQAVLDAYDGISFEEGTLPDFEKLESAFVQYAIFINFRNDTAVILSYDEFMKGYRSAVEGGAFKAVVEKEIYGKTELFGKIAHRISTYVTYIDDMDTIQERGINSFQLVKTDDGWKVSSVIWDVEKPGQPIPERYDADKEEGGE